MSTKSKLVDGLVPAGGECPFLNECALKTDNCPSHELGNERVGHGFSCGAARGFDLIERNKERVK